MRFADLGVKLRQTLFNYLKITLQSTTNKIKGPKPEVLSLIVELIKEESVSMITLSRCLFYSQVNASRIPMHSASSSVRSPAIDHAKRSTMWPS